MEHLNGKSVFGAARSPEPNQEAEQLVAYFGDLSNLAPMDAADMELVGREIVEATDIYRRKMLSFGFVLEQMIELLHGLGALHNDTDECNSCLHMFS